MSRGPAPEKGPPPLSNPHTHRPEFKARNAMESISGRKTPQEIAADHAVHLIQVALGKLPPAEAISQRLRGGGPHSWSTTEIGSTQPLPWHPVRSQPRLPLPPEEQTTKRGAQSASPACPVCSVLGRVHMSVGRPLITCVQLWR